MLFKLKGTDNREGCSKSPGNKHLRIGNKMPGKFLRLSVKKKQNRQGRALFFISPKAWMLETEGKDDFISCVRRSSVSSSSWDQKIAYNIQVWCPRGSGFSPPHI